jgi:hypothetical protein
MPTGRFSLAGPQVVTEQVRQLDAKQLADLLGDGREYCLRGFALRHERGYPAQRGLLLGQLTQPRLIRSVRGAGAWRVHKSDSNTRCLAGRPARSLRQTAPSASSYSRGRPTVMCVPAAAAL